jgi:hypothetical protein
LINNSMVTAAFMSSVLIKLVHLRKINDKQHSFFPNTFQLFCYYSAS